MRFCLTSQARPVQWMRMVLLVCGVGFAGGKSVAAASDVSVEPLRAKYAALREQLRNNPFHRALYLDSSQSSTSLKGEIYAAVDYPFAVVNRALNNPAHWCDVLILHINVKYCNAARRGDRTVLTVNIGRKYWQPIEDAHRLDFNYRAVATTPEYFALELNADHGPLSTHNYRIWIEAASLEGGRSFLHVTYAYEFGLAGRLAMQAYLATIGSDKVGFTVTKTLPNGRPVYIKGVRGVVERNTMRYYLAIDAYLDALTTAREHQLEKRLRKWYRSAEQYARQLHEMEREEYLDMKRREYRRQQVAR